MTRTWTSLRLAAALTAIALAAPAAAQATDYCVANPACVSGGGVDSGPGGTGLKAALDAAAAHANVGGPDRVLVGAGTYSRTGGNAPAFAANAGDALTLQGAGSGATVITREVFDSSTVLIAGAATTVRDLAITVPGGSGIVGLRLNGSADNVAVGVAAGGAALSTGVTITSGATFAHGTLTMPGGTGAEMQAASTLADSSVSGLYGVQASAGVVNVRGSRIKATSYGIIAYYAALKIDDTLLDLGGSSTTGIYSVSNVNGNASATLRHVTIVHGAAGTALALQANNGTTSTGTMRDSIISDVGHPIALGADQAGAVASLATSASSYPSAGILRAGSNGAATPAVPAASTPLSTAPGFVDAAGGDWRLRHDSPLVDAGTPGALAAGEPLTDADGLPRLVGGRRDAGAFEYQHRAPTATATASAPSTLTGVPITFSGSATDPDAGDGVPGYQWTFDDGANVPAGAGATHAFATAGAHTATLTATDPTGLTGTATVTVQVAAAEQSPGPGSPGAEPPKVTLPLPPPVLTALTISPRAFRPGAGPRHGARLTYRLSAPALVTFRVERAVAGRLRGGRCAARGHGKRCTRYVAVTGKLTPQAGVTGANSVRFSGRLGRRTLKPGRYRLVARAGTGPAVRAAFRIAGGS
jgi:PKD repeat protein